MRYFAFLRAINVGGHTVKNAQLQALFEELGLAGVSTFQASGNVMFDSPEGAGALEAEGALEARLEAHLEAALGYAVGVFLRTRAELEAVASSPALLRDQDAYGRYVGFLKEPPGDAARRAVAALSTDVDDLVVDGRELYWVCRIRSSDSEVTGPRLAKALGAETTLRNVNTVERLLKR